MTEITREHLELAALAAGHEVVCTEAEMQGCEDCSTVYTGLMLRGVQNAWHPHLDDGDAMRLAVRLSMTVWHLDAPVQGWATDHDSMDAVHSCTHDGTEPDKLRAWREAVTLCAAAVGERMRKGGA